MKIKWKEHRTVTLLCIIGVVYFFLRYLTPLFSPILLAMLFVTIFGPLLKKFQKKLHIHRQIGAVLLLVLAGAILFLLGWLLFSWLVGSLPNLTQWLDVWEIRLRELLHKVSGLAEKTFQLDGAYLERTLQTRIEEGIDYFQLEWIPGILSDSLKYAKNVAAFGGFLITFLITAVLLAKDYDQIMNNLLDREEFHVLLEVVCGIIRYIATYVKAQFIIMTAISVLAAGTLYICGIRQGVLWGILAGLLDAFPFVGTGIVLVPLSISRLIQGSYGQMTVCLLLYAACALLRELLEPKLIGGKLGVSPVAVLISIYAGVRLFGVWGILKGPLGFVIVYETWRSLTRRWEEGKARQDNGENLREGY